MKIEDLSNGAIVLRRNKTKAIYLKNANLKCGSDDVFINIWNGEYLTVHFYDDNLKYKGNSEFDIIAICDCDYAGDNVKNHIIGADKDKWTWKRDEKTVFTMQEVADIVGVDVSELRIKE